MRELWLHIKADSYRLAQAPETMQTETGRLTSLSLHARIPSGMTAKAQGNKLMNVSLPAYFIMEMR